MRKHVSFLQLFFFALSIYSIDCFSHNSTLLDFNKYQEWLLGKWTAEGKLYLGFKDKHEKIKFDENLQLLQAEKDQSKKEDIIHELYELALGKRFDQWVAETQIYDYQVQRKSRYYTLTEKKKSKFRVLGEKQITHTYRQTLSKSKSATIKRHSTNEKHQHSTEIGLPLTETAILIHDEKNAWTNLVIIDEENDTFTILSKGSVQIVGFSEIVYGYALFKRKHTDD